MSFHWRRSIGRKNRKEFSDSRYIAGINEFLNCPGLKKLHDTKRVKVVFLPHLEFTEYVDMFDIPDFVEVPVGKPFQDLIVQSDALVTDFSSNSFEMAYLDKPTVAYVPDEGCNCGEWPYHEERFGDYENIIHRKKPEDVVKATGDLLFDKRSFDFS